ncbi:Leucine-rich repeat protein kinase family protein [Abeliophyllum distichum]|uniref:Leucine-rich repeat protein kinase family protein n=1 Tax=Abeliophyllum distichum TaxID=126358 RepID=A0ABD1PU20_9LAMI
MYNPMWDPINIKKIRNIRIRKWDANTEKRSRENCTIDPKLKKNFEKGFKLQAAKEFVVSSSTALFSLLFSQKLNLGDISLSLFMRQFGKREKSKLPPPLRRMVWQAMGGRWTNGIQLSCLSLLILVLELQACCSLNSEGLALLEFRARVECDPSGALGNWNPNDCDPCTWFGVRCLNGEVYMLDLNGQYLQGILAPELGNLAHLTFLNLSKNNFSGTIPPQFGQLMALEVLDLRNNNLNGTVPAEFGRLHSLKRLLLCNNRFEGRIPLEIGKLNLLADLRFDENLKIAAAGIGCVNRKIGHCTWQSGQKPSKKRDSFLKSIRETLIHHFDLFPLFKFGSKSLHNHADDSFSNLPSSPEPDVIKNAKNLANNARRILVEQSSNLAAAPANIRSPSVPIIALPSSRSSGSFPAVPNRKKTPPVPVPSLAPPPKHEPRNTTNPPLDSSGAVSKPTDKESPVGKKSGNLWKYIVGISSSVFLLIFVAAIFVICRSRAAQTIRPWKTGLSGQLQKAFVTGVPKLNRAELETACEDFSNIINTYENIATVYKGTLSSGVEIAVVTTAIASLKDWSKRCELTFRKKIDMLSRVNHKNFVNLIGYCEEDEPFTRTMVLEYAPNGTLFEHLHVKELEHLDWNARMRIAMGTAYCLQYMHDLNPPVAHCNLTSKFIFLTDDYAPKVAEIAFWKELIAKSKNPENDSEHSELPPLADGETNVYSFGIVLLEIISGKLPYSEEQGPLINWASEYLNDRRTITHLIDPTLKSFKDKELDVVCEVIKSCIQQDARKRPSMKEIVQKLRGVIDVSPEAAAPRLSPLWWAELEILSQEAS